MPAKTRLQAAKSGNNDSREMCNFENKSSALKGLSRSVRRKSIGSSKTILRSGRKLLDFSATPVSTKQWGTSEDAVLITLVRHLGHAWSSLSRQFYGRTPQQCRSRWLHLHAQQASASFCPSQPLKVDELIRRNKVLKMQVKATAVDPSPTKDAHHNQVSKGGVFVCGRRKIFFSTKPRSTLNRRSKHAGAMKKLPAETLKQAQADLSDLQGGSAAPLSHTLCNLTSPPYPAPPATLLSPPPYAQLMSPHLQQQSAVTKVLVGPLGSSLNIASPEHKTSTVSQLEQPAGKRKMLDPTAAPDITTHQQEGLGESSVPAVATHLIRPTTDLEHSCAAVDANGDAAVDAYGRASVQSTPRSKASTSRGSSKAQRSPSCASPRGCLERGRTKSLSCIGCVDDLLGTLADQATASGGAVRGVKPIRPWSHSGESPVLESSACSQGESLSVSEWSDIAPVSWSSWLAKGYSCPVLGTEAISRVCEGSLENLETLQEMKALLKAHSDEVHGESHQEEIRSTTCYARAPAERDPFVHCQTSQLCRGEGGAPSCSTLEPREKPSLDHPSASSPSNVYRNSVLDRRRSNHVSLPEHPQRATSDNINPDSRLVSVAQGSRHVSGAEVKLIGQFDRLQRTASLPPLSHLGQSNKLAQPGPLHPQLLESVAKGDSDPPMDLASRPRLPLRINLAAAHNFRARKYGIE